jgi:hypothetical protein
VLADLLDLERRDLEPRVPVFVRVGVKLEDGLGAELGFQRFVDRFRRLSLAQPP